MFKFKKIATTVAGVMLASTLLTACDKGTKDSKTASGVAVQETTQQTTATPTAPEAQNNNTGNAPAGAFAKDFDTQLSYALGVEFGNGLEQITRSFKDVFPLNPEYVFQGMRDALDNKPKYTKEELQRISDLLRRVLVEKKPELAKNEKDFAQKAAYMIGYDVVSSGGLKNLIQSTKDIVNFNQDTIFMAMQDVIDNKVKMTPEQLQATAKRFQEIVLKQQASLALESNKKLKEEFSKKTNVQTTPSGIMYVITEPGSGEAIKPTDEVTVEYVGKLGDGRVFDSTEGRGATTFQLTQVIPGWTEAIQLVKKGGSIEMVIPSNLAYGDSPVGSIPPGSDLYFQIKVLDAKPAKAQTAPVDSQAQDKTAKQ